MKLCECGCGEPAPIAVRSDRRRGHEKGQPIRFVHGHAVRLMSTETRAKMSAARYGKTQSEETRRKRSEAFRGPRNPMFGLPGLRGGEHPQWKGDAVSYRVLHKWLERNYPKSGVCETCGSVGRTEWANISGEYRREDRSDWVEECRSCHAKRDDFVSNLQRAS